VDLGSEERHHPVENPQLKEYKAKLTVTGAVINSTLLSDPTARSSARTSRSFSRRLNDRLCGDLPHPFRFLSILTRDHFSRVLHSAAHLPRSASQWAKAVSAYLGRSVP
jgi:hypothetical protein